MFAPSSAKIALVLAGFCHLFGGNVFHMSGHAMQTIVGHLAWFALLSRPLFSCLHSAYDFQRQDGVERHSLLPSDVDWR